MGIEEDSEIRSVIVGDNIPRVGRTKGCFLVM
jgi:hypothetical protein